MIKNVTLGSDPELFLVDADNPERFISAIGKIGGSKDMPMDVGDGYSLQEDCTAVEYCIPPANSAKEFASNIETGLLKIIERVTPLNLRIKITPSAYFEGSELLHPNALLAGCDPDFCAWNKEMNEPANFMVTQTRVAGAHIHVGYDQPNEETSLNIIKAMDLFLGVPSILLDSDTERRKHYGKAGCFRFKKYGVEYRTLSNFWLRSEELCEWAFNNTMKAIDFINDDQTYLLDNFRSEIIMAINNNNKDIAENLVKEFNLPVAQCVES